MIQLTSPRAAAIQFNFRRNFHQIIDGRGRRERQDNGLEERRLDIQYTAQ